MRFGRLHDTRFPNLDNVDVYAYRNEFDYSRWVEGTKLKLCNVLWNSDYSDVALFETNIERDRWFNELQDYYTIDLETAIAYVPEQSIKIPVPYDVAARFNYLVVTIPMLPGSQPPINYEDEEVGIRKWYFFIDSINYKAASTTECRLSLDIWTQYQNDVYIKYMMLGRGHAPIAASDVDKYLANPIENNDYLLAPDVTPSDAQITRSANYIPFGNGTKYICFASTCPASELTQMGSVVHNDPNYTFGDITYSDINVRYGYQLQVNGFKVGNGDNYSALSTHMNSFGSTQDFIPNGSYMYAIAASSAEAFITKMMQDCPVFFRTVRACFMVDADMLTFGTSISFHGYTLRECVGRSSSVDISLTKEMFGFPEEYQHLAKLYTFPYSVIEITDNVGESVTVRIENTGGIVAHKDAMLAFPFLDARIWFDGINGTGASNYAWIDMNGATHQKQMPNADWSKMCFDMDIPCYAIFMDASTAWYLDNFDTTVRGNARAALAAYHNAVRSANTARANAVDSNDTMYANADRDATTLTTNTANTVDCNRANMDITIATNTDVTNRNNEAALSCMRLDTAALSEKTGYANNASWLTTSVQNESTAATTKITAGANMVSTLSSGVGNSVGMALTGVGAGAAVATALGTLISAGVQYAAATDSAGIAIQANTDAVRVMTDSNTNTAGTSNSLADALTRARNDCSTAVTTKQNKAVDDQTDNTGRTMNTNAGNSAATLRANSDATRDTGNDNAGYTRQVSVLNAQESLESTQFGIQKSLDSMHMKAPVQVTQESGTYQPWYQGTNGVQFKVKTMPNGDIRQIGDTFMRYGYALNQVWDVSKSGLCPMPHFCYWKADDIWVDDRASSNNLIQSIMIKMFMRGVTVWKNPDEIGKVSIYANR